MMDALIADSLSAFAGDATDCFSLQGALEFAFNTSAASRLPSEPN